MNARYYLRPNDTEHINISEFRAHRPSLHTSRDSKAEDPQMNVFKHPQDDEGFQAVKSQRPIGLMIDTNSSSV
ncbi:hypothetical protein AZE42_12313 [Rhizopogon vesiculosus]|uniref:Uncharacterized protein n=1 Tax=Rhizopogon vesiculosus TaxID=180088 RepID=A0A1J8R571_9AGAM|nr:hypothetical protein AZE42_12313 [Rhizopogon vesiculosus]